MRDNGSPAPLFDFDEQRSYFKVTLPVHPECVVAARR
jgi:ATP-dependent DNA helicase RecG